MMASKDPEVIRQAWETGREKAYLISNCDLTHDALVDAAWELAECFRDLDPSGQDETSGKSKYGDPCLTPDGFCQCDFACDRYIARAAGK
jgi:hypothetical protein